jgi:DNA polymerase elongation subunit (family B)
MTDLSYTKADVLGIEAKHITYVTDQYGKYDDAHVVKEIIHLKDGRKIPNLKVITNYERPFWVTEKGRQNHTEKKDYEYVANTRKYMSTQINLSRSIARVLGDYSMGPNPRLRQLARSPFLYGSDVSGGACLKNAYRKRCPDLISKNTVAGGDIETNVYEADKDGQIICMSVTYKTKVFLAYYKGWIKDIPDVVEQTHKLATEVPELKELIEKRGLVLEVVVCDTPAQVAIDCIAKLHEWKPDFFSFWNMDFDISRILKNLNQYGVDPKDVFSDQSVPKNFRYFDYNQAQAKTTTASGVTKSKSMEELWNWVTTPAHFQCIDAMSIYRALRIAKGKEPSYALDRILKKELKISKLKFPGAEHLTGIDWHKYMQTEQKVFYGLYNIVDSIRLEQLDEHVNDLSSSITMFSKYSDFKNFNSNPKRLCDDMHFWYLARPEPRVIGSSSDKMVHDLDRYVIGHEDWITTLPSYMAGPNGMACIKGFPGYGSLIWSHVADLDIVSTYPTVSQNLNIARETVVMEFGQMKGIPEVWRREVGVNLTGGRTNAVEICQKILKGPSMDQLLKNYLAMKAGAPMEAQPSSLGK